MLKVASNETPMGTDSGKFNLVLAKSFPPCNTSGADEPVNSIPS